MTIIVAGRRQTLQLPTGKVLRVVGVGTGTVWRLADVTGGEPGRPTSVVSDTTVDIGPFPNDTQHELVVATGSLTYTIENVDYASPAENDAAYAPKLTNDVLDLVGAGAPVDYTDGDPAATGEGIAGPGSRYTDITGANLYLNGGTKAQPIWKLVVRAI